MSSKSRRNSRANSSSSRPATPKANRTGASRGRPTAPQSKTARRKLEEFSAPILVTLHNLPRWLVPVGLAVLLFVGLLLSGPWGWLGAIFLAVIGVFVGWLTALSWPVLTGGSRFIRVVVTAVLFGLAVLKLMGRW